MKYTWIRATTAQVISTTPACVGAVLLTPKAGKQGYVTLYDGESVGDPRILTVRSGSGQTKVINFQPFLVTQRGLYASTLHDVEDLVIQLAWEHE
ncbi:hypothetical protein ES707_06702 [subsurface metagenome]